MTSETGPDAATRLLAVIRHAASAPHASMAAEALRDAAERAGLALTLDTGAGAALAEPDAVLLVGDATAEARAMPAAR
ncbi:hypothetical protein ACFFMP_17880 [Pseudoroseomonas cervicalis]|uniref:hypothetical protein n=1 Tax=Teichococcus cervicalis TaxID=204525 RepID=UPI0035E4A2F3